MSLQELIEGEKIKISVEVKNTGNFDGKEVVQLYIHDNTASMMRPLRELKAYKKQFIKQGEAATIEFEIGFEELGYYTEHGDYTVEAGGFVVYVGENCLTNNYIRIEIEEDV